MSAPYIDDPVLVEVTRGNMVESRHRGAYAVVDATGTVVEAAGAFERPVYARSAIKPVQALALVETGAADAYRLDDRHIALACASHGAEPSHLAVVRDWLDRIGCTEDDLACGAHAPLDGAAALALARAGIAATSAHNNCSGKHCGYLTVAKHLGRPIQGYQLIDHPVQQLVLGIFEQMSGIDLGSAARGIDGCGVPVIAMPLRAIALMMARLADPAGEGERRHSAASRIRRAMAAHPDLVGGTGRLCSEAIRLGGDRVLIKTGAEGTYAACLAGPGLGVAVKIADGAARAAQAVIGALLARLGVIDRAQAAHLDRLTQPAIRTHRGFDVGAIRLAPDGPLGKTG